MCRFVAYLGTPILVDEIIVKPSNSLIHQSYDALESSMKVNGDGFGLGWYDKSIRGEPGLFRSISPAWNDPNLLYNASFIRTKCFFAHVRAATIGGISLENTHPFHFEENLLMHNGGIEDFEAIKKDVIELLDDVAFNWIKGQSDTQYIFALFMTHLKIIRGKKEYAPAVELVEALRRTFRDIEILKSEKGLTSNGIFNIVMTDGNRMLATRYSTFPEQGTRTLYYTEKLSTYTYEGVLHTIEAHEARTATLVASEKLNHSDVWKPVPQNHAVYIDENLDVKLFNLNA